MLPQSTTRWPRERAWERFESIPRPLGFNYIPAHSVNYTEMWMEYNFDPAAIDRELRLAADIGFNCLRVVLPFVVWEAEPEALLGRLDRFLALCQQNRLRAMPTFFDDCAFGTITDPEFARQPEMIAGWYSSAWSPSPGHALVRDPCQHPRLERYVKAVLEAFRDDPRIPSLGSLQRTGEWPSGSRLAAAAALRVPVGAGSGAGPPAHLGNLGGPPRAPPAGGATALRVGHRFLSRLQPG